MTVSELIAHLHYLPDDMDVVFPLHSEYAILDKSYITFKRLGLDRGDGWIANKRDDKPSKNYVVIGEQ